MPGPEMARPFAAAGSEPLFPAGTAPAPHRPDPRGRPWADGSGEKNKSTLTFASLGAWRGWNRTFRSDNIFSFQTRSRLTPHPPNATIFTNEPWFLQTGFAGAKGHHGNRIFSGGRTRSPTGLHFTDLGMVRVISTINGNGLSRRWRNKAAGE